MKKIVAAIDGLKFSESAKDYAISMAKSNNMHLVGVCLEDKTYSSYKIYDLVLKEGATEKMVHEYEQKDQEARALSSKHFEAECRKAGLNYSIHHDRNIALQELLHESIYADLLVIDHRETMTHYEENFPTRFIRDLLADVQCPVLLVPEKFKPVRKVVLLYDGGPSSVYAIKMFTYLLPSLLHLPIEVVSVKKMDNDLHVPDNTLIKELLKRHCPNAIYTVLKGVPESEISSYLHKEQTNSLVVLGAYRRNGVSRWFRPSMADILMNELKLPLFIAHSK